MIDIARDIDSLSEFKRNTKAFVARLRKSGTPLVLTVNGKAALVVQDASAYQRRLEQEEQEEMDAFLRESIADADAGRTVDAFEFLDSLQLKKKRKPKKQ